MLEDGRITAIQAADAKAKPIQLNVQKDPNSLAPNFVEEIRRYLEAKYGSDQVHEGGLRVLTSLDMDLQKAANRAVLDGLQVMNTGKMARQSCQRGPQDRNSTNTKIPIGTRSLRQRYIQPSSPCITNRRSNSFRAALGDAANRRRLTRRKLPALLAIGDIVYLKVLSLDAGKGQSQPEQDSGAQSWLPSTTPPARSRPWSVDALNLRSIAPIQALRQVGCHSSLTLTPP
jgi:penicillin-binding protein 1A